MAEPNILDFHGDNLKTLYSYTTRDQVFDFLWKRADNPSNLPQGGEYVNSKLTPDQHILRRRNPGWTEEKPAESRFYAGLEKHWNISYWSPYDLLGLFLSKLGPAPVGQNADKRNFYLPPLGRLRPYQPRETGFGVGDPSFYYNCTWHPKTGEFFLGAVLADFDKSHTINNRGLKLGTRFGNCAETYPFVNMLSPHQKPQWRSSCHGLALQRELAKQALRTRGKYAYLADPCVNCQELLRTCRATVRNFRPGDGLPQPVEN
ncbi:hypothetical protein QBC38DRAFT_512501 [Podospora fimiseda]|uniref:Uncharacterized protein n=1 Tax=Podospora fimiseda TaxID=252190 RepID=A0AAN7BH04_9PEZI|nr:hypothetical protein QBC38DRAFT_512501 [Podospora fimiseda]